MNHPKNGSGRPRSPRFRRDQGIQFSGHPLRPSWLERTPLDIDMVFFDLETTGGNPQNSSITEIAAIKYSNGKEVGRFETLVNPQRPIPSRVRKLTGIDNELVSSAPTIEEVFPSFMEFIGDAVLASHGATCDVAYIAHYSKLLLNKELQNYYLCTHLIVSNFFSSIPSKSLTGVANYYGVEIADAHRAMADAIMTANIFWKMFEELEKNNVVALEDILKVQADHETLNRLGSGVLNRDLGERVPATPGVFLLFNSTREICYLSASSNLRRSLEGLTALGGERDFNRILVGVQSFQFERSSHFLGSLLHEAKHLQRLALPIDPRRFQRRSDGLVQVLLPADLIKYIESHPDRAPFRLPALAIRGEERTNHLDFDHHANSSSEDESDEESLACNHHRETIEIHRAAYGDKENVQVPIRTATRFDPSKFHPRFRISRSGGGQMVSVGSLSEGTGWFFGPFDNPKFVAQTIDAVLDSFGVRDETLDPAKRIAVIWSIILALQGKAEEELARLKRSSSVLQRFFKSSSTSTVAYRIEVLTQLIKDKLRLDAASCAKNGLAVLSNKETKELDVAVIVKNEIRKTIRIPLEEAEKLRSSRYFTRQFVEFDAELTNPCAPLSFDIDRCARIELFSYWLRARHGEGEWVEFSELSSLYDPDVLDK